MCISKGSYGEGEPKNIFLAWVQKSPRTCAIQESNRFYEAPYMGDNGNLRKFGAPYATVPCLHQTNVHSKRKLRGRRDKKYNPYVGAKSPQTCASRESNRFYAAPYMSNNENLRKVGATYRHGTVFTPKQCAYQKEAMGKQSPKIYSLRGFRKPINLFGPGK